MKNRVSSEIDSKQAGPQEANHHIAIEVVLSQNGYGAPRIPACGANDAQDQTMGNVLGSDRHGGGGTEDQTTTGWQNAGRRRQDRADQRGGRRAGGAGGAEVAARARRWARNPGNAMARSGGANRTYYDRCKAPTLGRADGW